MEQLYSASRKLWWLVLIRGIFAVLLGAIALFSPQTTLVAFVLVFGAYAIVDGISAVVMAIGSRKEQRLWGWLVVEGIISVLAGLLAIAWPGLTALAVGFIIGFWAVLLGVIQIVQAFALKRELSGVWGWLLASGIISLLWGVFVLAVPGIGILTVLWVFGIFALLFGIWTIVMSLRIRSAVRQVLSD
ncbi:HdeD family acid-resistance protein [Psychromicrobium sp. YIM B11713]|uniref:HdeD family acid-resistance protein n=1 Tax=Psychromicrobium sp. YIM B11713 TaxID=3145233 RepID=UPI00374F05B2